MKRSHLVIRIALIALLAIFFLAGPAGARPAPEPFAPPAGAPTVVSYQGQVTVSGTPFNGAGYFKFAIVDATPVSYWSNDGTSAGGGEPTSAVELIVTNGLFNTLLGDTGVMPEPLPAAVFDGADRNLRVWFSSTGVPGTFAKLAEDRRIAAVPYALQAEEARNADALDNLDSTAFAAAAHAHSGADITTGTVAEPRIDAALARDAEIMPAVLAADGASSGLDADLLDGQHAADFQARVTGDCGPGGMISAINPDGTVVCGSMPAEHTDRVGSIVTSSPALSFPLVGFSLEGTVSGTQTIYSLTFVHELDDSSPLFFESTALGTYLQDFTLFVEQPGTDVHYLKLDADPVTTANVAMERRSGASPLETITLGFVSSTDPVWSATGGEMPNPEDFPAQERVGTLTLGTSVTVAVFGHEWSVSEPAASLYPSFSPLIVTALLDGSAPQIHTWLDTGTYVPAAELVLFAPGSTDVMAAYQLSQVLITGAEQSASGMPGELARNTLTLDYDRIRWTVGTATFCWDLPSNSECP